MANCFKVLTRKKVVDQAGVSESQLARVLNTFDLTALGVGSTLGVGVYVLAGHVAKETAGPAVVLSFLIAAIASVFAGLCYAEFGSRVPRAGSAYVYSYVTVGELIAFIIGWNLILEYVIGSASVARGFTLYLDTLINHTLENTFKEIAPINVSFMSEYFDFFSFGITILLSCALAFGMKESSRLNNVFTILNIFIVLFVIIAGSLKAKPENWNIPESSLPKNSTFGSGGFFPYGMSGVIKGAATCFYGFVGFDCIATTGEEVKNPQRAIPLSIIASLLIIFMAYFGTATVLTLMVPYFEQDTDAPIPHAFAEIGWEWAKWIVAIGGMFGLCASLFGAMFPLPRIIYAMASDGIIFRFLGKVSPRFHTPLVGTLLAGLLTGLMAALFELSQLVAMMSIGTLLAYTIVAACVLLLRYSKDNTRPGTAIPNSEYTVNAEFDNIDSSSSNLINEHEEVTFCGILKQTFNFKRLENPTKTTQALVTVQICFYALLSLALGLCIMYLGYDLKHAHIWAIALVTVICTLMLLVLLSIVLQPTSKAEVRFKVPLVPLIPALSILINIYLMLMLDVTTWIRFGVWMAVGLPMYFICIRCADSFNNKNSYKTQNISNGHISIVNEKNGYVNSNYINDNKVVLEENKELEDAPSDVKKPLKLKLKAPSPPSEVKSVSPNLFSDSLSVNDALAALDDVLLKEENASSIIYEKPLDRKVSIDTMSNASNVYFEESVIALIHREDIGGDDAIPVIEEQNENDVQSDIVSQTLEEDQEEQPDELENSVVIHIALEEAQTETSDTKSSNVPPPPPMEEYENYLARKIPRISLIKTVDGKPKLENEPEDVPPPDYSRAESPVENGEEVELRKKPERTPLPTIKKVNAEEENLDNESDSSKKEEVEGSDVNITFGSKQHQQVMSKLNQLFERRSLGLASPAKLTKPTASSDSDDQPLPPVAVLPGMKPVLEVVPKPNTHDDNLETSEVVEEVMKPADIKIKLEEILKADPRLTMRPLKSNIAISNLIDQSELNKMEETAPFKDGTADTKEEIDDSKEAAGDSKEELANFKEETAASKDGKEFEKNASEGNSESDKVISPAQLPSSEISNNKSSLSKEVTAKSDISAIEKHKNLMQNTLNSIKLKKLQSLTLAEG